MTKLKCIVFISQEENQQPFQLAASLDVVKNIQSFNNYSQTLEFIQQYKSINNTYPEFIFIDIEKKKNAFDFLTQLTLEMNNENTSKIILLVTPSDFIEIRKAKKIGIYDYIFKPFTKEGFIKLLQESKKRVTA